MNLKYLSALIKGLMSKNNQALMMKQNRYKNLEAREEKMEL
jgi:hypothetical protein